MSVKIVWNNGIMHLEGHEQIKKAIDAFDFPERIKTLRGWNNHGYGTLTLNDLEIHSEDLLLVFFTVPFGCSVEKLNYYEVCGKTLTANQKDGVKITYIPEQLVNDIHIIREPEGIPIAYQWYNALIIPFDLPHGQIH